MSFIENAFWREETALSQKEASLLGILFSAHQLSAIRNNASTQALKLGYGGSGNITGGIVAALGTLGGKHAPVQRITELFTMGLSTFETKARTMLLRGEMIPGWGNSFVKGQPDHKWNLVSKYLRDEFPEQAAYIDAGTKILHAHGKMVYPNPGAFTGAAAAALGMPPALAPYLFIASRLEAWAIIASQL